MNVKIKKVNLSEIKINPDNPRQISKKQMERLIKSVNDFSKMLELRPIIYDENHVILGGNMRFLALKKLGYMEVPNTWVRCVTDLTEEEKRRFVIADNADGFGEWDMDMIANEWDALPLTEWGMKDEFHCLDGSDEEKLVQEEKEIKPYKKVHILISVDIDAVDTVVDPLDKLRRTKGVEIEQGAN